MDKHSTVNINCIYLHMTADLGKFLCLWQILVRFLEFARWICADLLGFLRVYRVRLFHCHYFRCINVCIHRSKIGALRHFIRDIVQLQTKATTVILTSHHRWQVEGIHGK